jgi:hypothetical protein
VINKRYVHCLQQFVLHVELNTFDDIVHLRSYYGLQSASKQKVDEMKVTCEDVTAAYKVLEDYVMKCFRDMCSSVKLQKQYFDTVDRNVGKLARKAKRGDDLNTLNQEYKDMKGPADKLRLCCEAFQDVVPDITYNMQRLTLDIDAVSISQVIFIEHVVHLHVYREVRWRRDCHVLALLTMLILRVLRRPLILCCLSRNSCKLTGEN